MLSLSRNETPHDPEPDRGHLPSASAQREAGLTRREALEGIGVAAIAVLVSACGGGSGGGASATPTASAVPSATTAPTASPTSAPPATATGTAQAASPTGTPSPTQTPSPGSLSCVVSPAETEGPYFVDERLNRSDLTSGTTRVEVLDGLPLRLQVGVYTVSGDTCTPLAGAQVDIWHADSAGVYSDIQAQSTVGQTFLRGYQITDQNGAVGFDTIYPGWYPSRTVHIHFKVRTFSASGAQSFEFTSQLFFDDTLTDTVFANAPYNSRGQRDTRNAADMVYNTGTVGALPAGSALLLDVRPASAGAGYVGTFTIGLTM